MPGVRRPRVRRPPVVRRRAGAPPRRDPRTRPGPARAGRRRLGRELEATSACRRWPTPCCASRIAPFLDIELKGLPRPGGRRGPRRRPRPGSRQRRRLVVRCPRRSQRSAGLAPAWPRWLNAWDLDAVDDRGRRSSSAAGRSPSTGTRSMRGSLARRPGRPAWRWRPGRSGDADLRPARASASSRRASRRPRSTADGRKRPARLPDGAPRPILARGTKEAP